LDENVESYKELKVWQEGVKLVEEIYELTRSFPPKEQYSLTSQIQRAAVSIPTNIAEGWGRGKTGEYVQFLRIARGSLMELETQLIISQRLNYIDQNTLSQFEENIEKIGKMINALIKNLGTRG
jgi:four helix bundle protein